MRRVGPNPAWLVSSSEDGHVNPETQWESCVTVEGDTGPAEEGPPRTASVPSKARKKWGRRVPCGSQRDSRTLGFQHLELWQHTLLLLKLVCAASLWRAQETSAIFEAVALAFSPKHPCSIPRRGVSTGCCLGWGKAEATARALLPSPSEAVCV